MDMDRVCQGRLRFFGHCERKPTVECDGKWYCWQHDPVRLKEAADARWAERKKEIARIEAEADARINRRKLEEAAGVDKLSDEALREIARLGGIRKMIEQLTERVDREEATEG